MLLWTAMTSECALPVQPLSAAEPVTFMEVGVSSFGFALSRRITSRAGASARFKREADRILACAQKLDPALAAKTVLVERQKGLEQNCRHWSLLMTLDHLAMINTAVLTIIESILQNIPLAPNFSTAEAKPKQEQSIFTIERFRKITEQYLEHIDRMPNLHCKMRHTHHQFGPLDAHGWHCLAAIHQNIHRKQIERIVVIATNPDSLIL